MAKTGQHFVVSWPDGRTVESRFLPIDTMMAEKHVGRVDQLPVAGSYYAIFNALKRQGEVQKDCTFDEFIAAVCDIDLTDEAAASPNGSAPGTGLQSPPSPTTAASAPATSSQA